MRELISKNARALTAAAIIATAAPAGFTAAQAAPVFSSASYSDADVWQHRRDRDRRDYRDYRGRGRYGEPVYRDTRVWRGRDGRVYCRKRDGTTGLIVGGAVGALLGREIDGGYNRSTGTILGGAVGALLGREVARSGGRCR